MLTEHHIEREATRVHPAPSDAQKEAGNYSKGHPKIHGMEVSIETARGQNRTGVGSDGEPWSVKMPHHYGYIRRTEGADGDQIDAYIGPHIKSPKVFVVDQHDADTGSFDEHKAFLGFANRKQVEGAYRKSFSDDRANERMGGIKEMSTDEFKQWARKGDTKNPVAITSSGESDERAEGYADGGTVNPFDAFDASGAAPSTDANPFDAFDQSEQKSTGADALRVQGRPQSPQPTIVSTLQQIPAGANDMLASALGAPVDALNKASSWGAEGLSRATNAVRSATGMSEDQAPASYQIGTPVGGSESIKKGLGLLGANPDDTPARNAPEKIARGAGSGAAMMVAPQALLGALSRAGALTPKVLETLKALFGSAATAPQLAGDAAIGAVSGAGAAGAGEAAPDGYKPLAEIAGGLTGGMAAVGAGAAGRAGGKALRDYVAPITERGQQRVAAETLGDAATSRATAIDAIDNAPNEIVSGSKPTTFQQSGDMGLGALERRVATENPVDFNQRRSDQNSARLDTLSDIQPGGSAADVSGVLRQQLRDIDEMTGSAVTRATGDAEAAATRLGGATTPERAGDAIQRELAPVDQSATAAARTAVEGLGGAGVPEQYGSGMRGTLAQARTEAKRRERALWNAVDPDETLALPVSSLSRAGQEIEGSVTASARPVAGEERAILDTIAEYGPVMPFKDVTDLRSRVSTAMREELRASGETPVYARLARLRGAVENTISNAVEHQAAQESQAVARGEMNADATMFARVNSWVDDFRSRQNSAVVGEDVGGTSAQRGPRNARVPGAAREAGNGSRGTESDTGGASLAPNFDEAARDRLRTASAATRDRKQTYDAGPVGDVLRSAGMQGQYRSLDAAVPAKIFRPGPGGFEAVQAYRRAAGNSEEAVGVLHDYAAASLRRAAERPDGTLDPRRYEAWQRQHRDALRAVPELEARFGRAAQASETLENFRPLNPDVSAAHMPEMFFHPGPAGFEDAQQLRTLIGNDRATALLSDYAASRLRQAAMRPDGTIDPAKFKTWQKSHSDALRALPEISGRFSDAASATQAIDAVAAVRKDALETFQKGNLAKIIDAPDADSVTKVVGAIFGQKDAVAQMRKIVAQTDKDPAARDGLRRAVADHMARRLISNTEAATSGKGLIKADQFQTFIRENNATLNQIFSTDEMNSLRAIGQDLQRANRSMVAVKLPGGSNTAQDQAAERLTMLQKVLSHWVGAAGAATGTVLSGGPWGAVAGVIGGEAVKALRDAGMKKADDLVKAAMLDPKLAKTLLMQAPQKPGVGSATTLLHQLRRMSVFAPAFAAADQKK